MLRLAEARVKLRSLATDNAYRIRRNSNVAFQLRTGKIYTAPVAAKMEAPHSSGCKTSPVPEHGWQRSDPVAWQTAQSTYLPLFVRTIPSRRHRGQITTPVPRQ